MNTLNDYVAEYIEYCEYRKRLDRKTLKAYRIDLKQYPKLSSIYFYHVLVTPTFQPSFTKLVQITPYFAKNIVKIHTTLRLVIDESCLPRIFLTP